MAERRASRLVDALIPDEPDSAARRHLVVSGLLLALTAVLGIAVYLGPVGADVWRWGRLRAMYGNALVFGWLLPAGLAVVYYLIPRLTGIRLWSERVANANLYVIGGAVIAGLATLATGLSQGGNLLEFPLVVDVVLLVGLATPAVVVLKTVSDRREPRLYVSVWYLAAAVVWLPLTFVVGNMPGFRGAGSVAQGAFFSGTVLNLWGLAIVLGGLYYVIPKETGNPLYSARLAEIGFWSLALAAPWTGLAGLVHGPVPAWVQTVAIVFTIGLLLPMVANLINLAATMADQATASPALRAATLAGGFYAVWAVVGALASLRTASAVVGFTPFGDGLFFLGAFGVVTLGLIAVAYHINPRLIGRAWFSDVYISWHSRLTVAGVAVVALAAWVGGLSAGFGWLAGAVTGTYENFGAGFSQTAGTMTPWLFIGFLGATVTFVAQLAFVANLYRSYTAGAAVPQEILVPIEAEEG